MECLSDTLFAPILYRSLFRPLIHPAQTRQDPHRRLGHFPRHDELYSEVVWSLKRLCVPNSVVDNVVKLLHASQFVLKTLDQTKAAFTSNTADTPLPMRLMIKRQLNDNLKETLDYIQLAGTKLTMPAIWVASARLDQQATAGRIVRANFFTQALAHSAAFDSSWTATILDGKEVIEHSNIRGVGIGYALDALKLWQAEETAKAKQNNSAPITKEDALAWLAKFEATVPTEEEVRARKKKARQDRQRLKVTEAAQQ